MNNRGISSRRALLVEVGDGAERARRERPPGPAREGLEGKTATATGTMTTMAQTKVGKPRRPGKASGRAPRKPCGHGRVQSAPAGAAPRGPRGWPHGSPARYIFKEALFVPHVDLRESRAFAGNRQTGPAFNSLRTNSRSLGTRSISMTPAALAGPQERSGGLATARKDRFLETDGRGRAGGPDRAPRRRERRLRRV